MKSWGRRELLKFSYCREKESKDGQHADEPESTPHFGEECSPSSRDAFSEQLRLIETQDDARIGCLLSGRE